LKGRSLGKREISETIEWQKKTNPDNNFLGEGKTLLRKGGTLMRLYYNRGPRRKKLLFEIPK